MKKSRLCHVFCRLSRRWRPAFEGVESDSFNCIVWVFGFRYNNAILSCQSGNFVPVLIPSWHGWFSCYPRDIVGNIHSSPILVIWRSWWRAQRMMPIRWNAIECHDINWFGFTKVCSIYMQNVYENRFSSIPPGPDDSGRCSLGMNRKSFCTVAVVTILSTL